MKKAAAQLASIKWGTCGCLTKTDGHVKHFAVPVRVVLPCSPNVEKGGKSETLVDKVDARPVKFFP